MGGQRRLFMNQLVSIIIPTKNSSMFLENTLKSIKEQSYKKIEIIIVDNKSTDKTLEIARKYRCKVFQFNPKVSIGRFDASHKRNYGVTKAKGEYVYYVDADMELTKNVVSDCVRLCNKGFDCIMVPEDSFGIGIWAQAKYLQRHCYIGDDELESPRFFKKKVWQALGGLDVEMGGGGDDWDLSLRAREAGYKITRTTELVMHNEGDLKLFRLFKKRIMYGKDLPKYLSKQRGHSVKVFLFRKAYLKNWRLFLSHPIITCAFIVMRSTEVVGTSLGVMLSVAEGNKK